MKEPTEDLIVATFECSTCNKHFETVLQQGGLFIITCACGKKHMIGSRQQNYNQTAMDLIRRLAACPEPTDPNIVGLWRQAKALASRSVPT